MPTFGARSCNDAFHPMDSRSSAPARRNSSKVQAAALSVLYSKKSEGKRLREAMLVVPW
jgi:hypothetical protein